MVCLLVGTFAPAQTPAGHPSIPEPGFADGWAKAGPLRTFTGEDLFNQIDGGAELFLEFGFVRLRLQAYAKGRAELTLNAYEMDSAASALGVYLMKMGREAPFEGIAARNSSEEVQLTILKGRYFVQVDNLGEVAASRAEAVALANAFLAGVAEEPAETPLGLLPAEGRVPGSERLIRGRTGSNPSSPSGKGTFSGSKRRSSAPSRATGRAPPRPRSASSSPMPRRIRPARSMKASWRTSIPI